MGRSGPQCKKWAMFSDEINTASSLFWFHGKRWGETKDLKCWCGHVGLQDREHGFTENEFDGLRCRILTAFAFVKANERSLTTAIDINQCCSAYLYSFTTLLFKKYWPRAFSCLLPGPRPIIQHVQYGRNIWKGYLNKNCFLKISLTATTKWTSYKASNINP